jgi:hypothetical protein
MWLLSYVSCFYMQVMQEIGGMCYTIKSNTEECGWTKLIMCWKITRAGKKANPTLRVNPGYNG